METLLVLSHLTVILLFGVIFAMLAKRWRIPHPLFLMLSGLLLGQIEYNGEPLIDFPHIFVTSIGIIALVLVVFDASSRFKWKEFDTLTKQASKITMTFLVVNALLLTILTTIVFDMSNIYLAMIFAVLMSGTSADVVLSMFQEQKNKVTNLLEVESILNTPLTVLLPFIILSVMQTVHIEIDVYSGIAIELLKVIQQFVTGIGAGVIMGIIIFKLMRKYYSSKLSPLILITSTLLTYILAEHLSGNGVVAVTILGLFFGNLYVKQKHVLFEFSSTFGNSLMILVFVLVGLKIDVPLGDLSFLISSFVLFVLYVAIRSMTIYISTLGGEYTNKEKIFMTLNFPKGIAAAVIAFSLVSYNFGASGLSFTSLPGGELTLNLIVIFMLYSLALSTVVTRFSKYFIRVDITKK